MNIRHEKVYEQLAAIAPTVMIDDDIAMLTGVEDFSKWDSGLIKKQP